MVKRLTEEQMEAFEKVSLTPSRAVTLPTMQLRDLVRELRERRELLSPADIEALRYLKCFAEVAHETTAYVHGMEQAHIETTQRALDAIERLIGAGR